MSINNLKDFHEAFYQPNNQIIFLTGKFDDNVIDLIEKSYNSFNKDYKNVEKILLEEPANVMKVKDEIESDTKKDFYNITYKIDLSNLSPLERNKFDYYLSIIYKTNFGEQSELFDYLVKNKLSTYCVSFNYEPNIINNIALLSLTVFSSEKKALDAVIERFNNLILDEKDFNIAKNNLIIENINRMENINFKTNNFTDNILYYDLYQYDDIEFIKSLYLEELKNLFNKIDFSNYVIIKNK